MKEEKKRLKIAWLFPDILYLHGERGNILALERLGAMMGLETEVAKIDDGIQDFEPMDYHHLLPAGEMVSMPGIIEKLRPHREELENFIDSGRVLLVTGTSQCIFGGRTERSDGPDFDGLGIIDCDYRERKLVTEMTCVSGQTTAQDMTSVSSTDTDDGYSQQGKKELGTIIYGFGNNEGSTEGIVKKNSIFTNLLGPAPCSEPMAHCGDDKAGGCGRKSRNIRDRHRYGSEMKSLEVKKSFCLE